MMRYLILFLLCLFLNSCNKQEQEKAESARVNIAEIDFPETSIALIGGAQNTAAEWEEYNAFKVALENYDHSPTATRRLATLVEEMRSNVAKDFDNQPIKSRMLVLETRLKRYASFLEYQNRTEDQYKSYYGKIILALDQLNNQLNEKDYYDQQKQELIEQLKLGLQDPDAAASDSSP